MIVRPTFADVPFAMRIKDTPWHHKNQFGSTKTD
jgi:hypothetical protein